MELSECIFCNQNKISEGRAIAENEQFFSMWDSNPVSKGHALVIPKRHILSFFDMTDMELMSFYKIASEVKLKIDSDFNPDALNIGVNDGVAAGRTVHHLHIHLMPRYVGDVPEPRGGVRHIIPGKGSY